MRPQFGAGRDLGPPERREGGSQRSTTADHIHLAADVQFWTRSDFVVQVSNQEVACLTGTTVVNFYEVVNIDQYLGQRGWKLVGITARQRHLSVTGSVVLPP